VKKQLPEEEIRICPTHNVPYEGLRYCSECEKEEKERIRQADERLEREQKEREEQFAKKIADNPEDLLQKIGIGERHIHCSFDNYIGGDKVKKACLDIVNNPCDVLLSGPPGCGKTHLAIAIFRELIKNRNINVLYDFWQEGRWKRNASFITVPDLLLNIRKVFNGQSKNTEDEIVDYFSSKQFLLLDDLGAEKTTEWSITTLYTIIDRRYRENLQTIVTTNLTIDQIGSQISERIASRLSSGKIIKINAPDYRKKRNIG